MSEIKIKIKNGILEYQPVINVSNDYLMKLKSEHDGRIICSREATKALAQLVEAILEITGISTVEPVEVEEYDESGLLPDPFKTIVLPCKRNIDDDSIEGLDLEDVW